MDSGSASTPCASSRRAKGAASCKLGGNASGVQTHTVRALKARYTRDASSMGTHISY
jgi:hypothetical protein